MNNKIFGIIVCILLMTSSITIAENIEKTSNVSSSKNISGTSLDVDPPIWKVDNYWSFKIEDMTIDYEKEGQLIHVKLETNKLQLKVVEVTSDSYIMEIDAMLTGSGNGDVNLGQGPINVTINLKDTSLTGTIVFNKSDLGIKQLNPKINGRLWVKINELPDIDFPIPKIPFGATIDIFTNLKVPFPFINFPLNVSNVWGVPATNISVDGTIRSPWFYLINTINNVARIKIIWNFIMKLINGSDIDEETARNISDMIVDILPEINISYVLTKYMKIGNFFETKEISNIFICNDIEEITVQGKTYNAYNISLTIGIGNIYYAPEAGNIIKISGYFKNIIPFISDLNIELIETNYQP